MLEKFDKIYNLLANSARLFVTFLFFHILELSVAQSQRITPYFSTISEIPLYRGNQTLLIGDFNGDGLEDIGSYGNGIISIIYNMGDLNNFSVKYFETESKNFKAVVGDINSDNIDDIVYLDSEIKFLRSYLGSANDTLISKWKFKVDDIYTKIKLEDINNDNKKDIILYGKKNLGLTILPGKGDGTFKYPITILDDYFFSEIQICNCSEDNLPDIFAVNWIENKILYFTSYAPLKYLAPAIYSFSNEPISINNFYLNEDEIADLFVLFEDRSTISTFVGDNLGNYLLKDKLTLNYKIDKYVISNFGSDLRNILVTLSRQNKQFSIILKDNFYKFREEIVYSSISEISDFALYKFSNSGFYNLVGLSEKSKKIYLIQNGKEPQTDITASKYISIPMPGAIFTCDLNNDNLPDLIVSSNSNYNTSCYINQGNRSFGGMLSLKGFPNNIMTLAVIQNNDNGLQFLTTHEDIPTINLVSFNVTDFSSFYYPISGITQPNILSIKKLNQNKNTGLDFYVASYSENLKGLELYNYKQFDKYKFTETTLDNGIKDLVGISVNDLNYDGVPDYLYLSRTSRKSLILGAQILDSNYNRIKKIKYFEIADTSIVNYHLITKDLNKDKHLDLILYSPQKMELLISLYNVKDSVFNKPHQKIENINLGSLNNLQFCDLDNDDNLDLLIGNIYTQTLQVYFNKGDGTFSAPVTLMGIYEISSFVANDFDRDSFIDIALVYKEGYVKIIYGQK